MVDSGTVFVHSSPIGLVIAPIDGEDLANVRGEAKRLAEWIGCPVLFCKDGEVYTVRPPEEGEGA